MIIDLEKEQIEDLLILVKTSSFRGDGAEKVVEMKKKLEVALKEGAPKENV